MDSCQIPTVSPCSNSFDVRGLPLWLLALLSIVLDFEVRFGRSGYCSRTRDPQLAFPSIFLLAVGGKYRRHFLGRRTARRASSQFLYLKKESDDSYSPAATCNVVVEALWLTSRLRYRLPTIPAKIAGP